MRLADIFYRQPQTFMNTECKRIAYEMASALEGEAWYGDSVRKILDGITAKQAEAHPIPNAHSIWELVAHAEAWVKLAEGAVRGVPIPAWSTMPKEMDWPPVTAKGEQAWKQALSSYFSSHQKMVEAIKAFSDERLETAVPGRSYDFYHLFQGMTQHAIYHAGQIALLKKALA